MKISFGKKKKLKKSFKKVHRSFLSFWPISLGVFVCLLLGGGVWQTNVLVRQHETTVLGASNHPYCNNWPNIIGSTKSPNGSYFATWFGCSHLGDDSGDNCQAACGYTASGERSLRWFTADADRYGCGTKVKVTNKYGKAVIAEVIDRGPDCRVEENQAHQRIMDLSHDTYCTLGFENGASNVTVTVVASNSRLGPTDGVIPSNCNRGQPKPKPTATPTPIHNQALCKKGSPCMDPHRCKGEGGKIQNACGGGYYCCGPTSKFY